MPPPMLATSRDVNPLFEPSPPWVGQKDKRDNDLLSFQSSNTGACGCKGFKILHCRWVMFREDGGGGAEGLGDALPLTGWPFPLPLPTSEIGGGKWTSQALWGQRRDAGALQLPLPPPVPHASLLGLGFCSVTA